MTLRFLVLLAAFFPAVTLAAQPAQLPLEAFGQLPSTEDMAISPSGKKFAVAGRVKNERVVLVIDEAGELTMRVPLEDVKFRSLQWAGNDFLLVHVRSTEKLGYGFTTDKAEVDTAVILNLQETSGDLAFKRSKSIANAVRGNYGIRLTDDRWRAYLGGMKLIYSRSELRYIFDHGRATLYELDLEKNKARTAAPAANEGHWRKWLIDESGQIGATLDVARSSGKWTLQNSERTTIASGIAPNGGISLLFFGRDGASAIYEIEDIAAGKNRWFKVPLAGGEAVEILADMAIERTYVDPTNGRLIGYREDSEAGKIVLFDGAKQNILSKVYRAFPNLDVDIHDWTPASSHILVHVSGSADSGSWYVIDMTKGRANPVGYDRPTILSKHVGPISTLDYQASDGLELNGILTLPPDREAKDLPVIMLPHGGPFGIWDTEKFDWLAQAFASRGYAVFQPNFRGSGGRNLDFERAGYGQWGRKMQTDISDGLAALAEQGTIDPKRACILGASYGGYAALAGVTLQQGLYRCAVAIAPVSDIREFYRTDYKESGRSKMLRRNQRERFGDPSGFDAISPRKHADRADAPVLLIHGEDDTRLPVEQSSRMADALEDAGKPYRYIVLDDEDHWLSRSDTRMQALRESMDFVLKHNPPR
ncbi:MAG: S9 family peptidase [Sphingomonadaceae bacterium]|nr:S9 family peptidase [Sphingomonadaceae bacterium]